MKIKNPTLNDLKDLLNILDDESLSKPITAFFSHYNSDWDDFTPMSEDVAVINIVKHANRKADIYLELTSYEGVKEDERYRID